MLRFHGWSVYLHGVREAVRANAPAFGFSIMVTATFGMLAVLDRSPEVVEIFLFAPGAALGFVAAFALARLGPAEDETEFERLGVLLLAAALNVSAVLAGLGAATLVALLGGWPAWLLAPFAASVVYVAVSGADFAIAEEAEEDRGQR